MNTLPHNQHTNYPALSRGRAAALLVFALGFGLCADGAASEFAVNAAGLAAAKISDGQRKPMLRVSVSNPAANGAPVAQLRSIGLRVEKAAGIPLTSAHAAALFATVEICGDTNGSSAFEPDIDEVMATLYALPVAADGTVSVALDGVNPAIRQVASGLTRHYFVVVRVTDYASAANPNTFRVAHVANGPARTAATDAGTGALLTLAATPDVPSSLVTAIVGDAPTTSGISDIVVFDPSVPATVLLPAVFHDAEDLSTELTYSVAGNTAPSLFSFVGIDPLTGLLKLDVASGSVGAAQLTIRATDLSGKSVFTTFAVRIVPSLTYADFANLYLPSDGSGTPDPTAYGSGSGVSNLLKYAFFLKRAANGDVSGLPRLIQNGNARLFTHLKPKVAPDLEYHYEVSTNLTDWQPAKPGIHYYENSRNLPDGSTRVELLMLMKWPAAFMRVRAGLATEPPLAASPATGPLAPVDPPPGQTAPPPSPPAAPGSTAHPIRSTVSFPERKIISTSQPFATAVCTADFDGDGIPDVAAASLLDDTIAWYRSLGDGNFSGPYIVSTASTLPAGIKATDIDGDGRVDLVAASETDNTVAWFRNVGGSLSAGLFGYDAATPGANRRIISQSTVFAAFVNTADMNGDGFPDVLSTSLLDNKVAWYQNDGLGNFGWNPAAPTANQKIISTACRAPSSVLAQDLDGDGVIDVAVTSISDDRLSWFKGSKNAAGALTFTHYIISNTQLRAAHVIAADIDGDGWQDLVCASPFGSKITYFRNNTQEAGAAAPFFGPEQIINAEAGGAYSVVAHDMDQDGRVDIAAALLRAHKVTWYRNEGPNAGGATTFGPEIVITDDANNAASVAKGDLNNDGAMDIVAAAQGPSIPVEGGSQVLAFFNQGRQCTMDTVGIASSPVTEGGRAAVLRITVNNLGVAGDENAQLRTLSLFLGKGGSPGTALTTTEANGLIENLYVYADSNASGTFEPAVDQPVGVIHYLATYAGKLVMPLGTGASSSSQVPPGGSRHFFVVPQLSLSAGSLGVSGFRITHVSHGIGRTTLEGAGTHATLAYHDLKTTDVTSPEVSVSQTNAPTTTGLPDITVVDTSDQTFVPLFSAFHDFEDNSSSLGYSVTAISNPGLFSFAGIDPVTGQLGLKYRPGIAGSAQLTIRATDSSGKSVSASFHVFVSLADSFSNWAAANFGTSLFGNGPLDFRFGDGTNNLLKYAFSLNPNVAGDFSGLPILTRQGNVRVFSHRKPLWAADLTYFYDVSTDLVNWLPAVNGVHFQEFSRPLASGVSQSDLVLLIDWPKAFIRVRPSLSN